MKKQLVWLLAVPLLAACEWDLDGLGSCNYDRDFSDAISASGISTLRVLADDGDLEIVGRSNLSQVRVRAEACSSSRRTTDDIDFFLYRDGGTIELETDVPHFDGAHLNLVIEVPQHLAVAVYHEAGDIDIRNVDFALVDDGSGHIDIRNVATDVEIYDGSGHIYVYDVGGSVEIEDGSGDIEVDDVGGDLWVRSDGSGQIRYRNVRGRVDLP